MFAQTFRSLLIGAAAAGLAGCGGDGPSTIPNPPPTPTTPSPTPPPPPTPPIISGVSASQEFPVKGATFNLVSFPEYDGPLTGASDQLRIRYVADSNRYEVMTAGGTGWNALTKSGSGEDFTSAATAGMVFQIVHDTDKSLSDPANIYTYSALANWWDSSETFESIAFGVASGAGDIPVSGQATYNGYISGHTNETWDWADWGRGPGAVDGDIQLTFDFGAGSLAGSISPRIWVGDYADLPSMNFVETIFSKGSTTFSGKFDTPLPGANAFSGMFTGPQAKELIGNFVFPYKSPFDSKNYEAGGGFIAKH